MKALRKQFREDNGRAPRPSLTVLIEDKEAFANERGMRQFAAGYEQAGELRFRKVMGVAATSEWRALKRGKDLA